MIEFSLLGTLRSTHCSNKCRVRARRYSGTNWACKRGQYFVVTLHRPANVDGEQQLLRLLHAVAKGTGGLPVVFPVHPRTAKNLRELEGQITGMCYVDPQGYLEFNYLVKHAKAVIIDLGGITEETTVMGVPCLTSIITQSVQRR